MEKYPAPICRLKNGHGNPVGDAPLSGRISTFRMLPEGGSGMGRRQKMLQLRKILFQGGNFLPPSDKRAGKIQGDFAESVVNIGVEIFSLRLRCFGGRKNSFPHFPHAVEKQLLKIKGAFCGQLGR